MFIFAVTELYGPEQARISGKEWLHESEPMDNLPLATSRNWRGGHNCNFGAAGNAYRCCQECPTTFGLSATDKDLSPMS
jgi:hypothetical protein